MPDEAPSARGPLAAFAAFGVFWGAWGVLLPAIKEQTGASIGELGIALLFVAAAALPSMLATGVLLDRFGLRLVALSVAFFGLAVLLPGFVHSVWALALVLVVVGAGSGALDVSINVAASSVEAARCVRLMQKAHAFFSGGFLLGSGLTGLARAAGAGPRPILLGASATLLAAAWLNRGASRVPAPAAPGGRRLRFSKTLVALGVLCAVAFVVESGIEHWSALFLETELDASPGVGALGPAFFAVAMVLGRLAGQRYEERVGDVVLLAGGASVAAAGLTLAAMAPSLPLAVTGFFLGGGGISVAAPTLFGAAGRTAAEAERGSSIASVTTVSYLGFLSGPPLIGAVSGALDLRAGIGLLAAIALLLALASSSFGRALPLRRLQPAPRGRLSQPG